MLIKHRASRTQQQWFYNQQSGDVGQVSYLAVVIGEANSRTIEHTIYSGNQNDKPSVEIKT